MNNSNTLRIKRKKKVISGGHLSCEIPVQSINLVHMKRLNSLPAHLPAHTSLMHSLHMTRVFHKARLTYCRHIATASELGDSCEYYQ